ncbi:MAG: polysaccharide biosynthesis tyrosine autokinase, partial [Bacteroidales bacterium]|nr:polysaccharide biosynthesis tyrosine autokinase [Bacteroidales bacterium]
LPGSIIGEVGGLVSEYNSTVLNRNYLIKNSSTSNPLVIELTETLNTYRQNILSAIDAQLEVLQAQRANLQQKEKQINKKIADSPNQTKQLLSIERQQKVKESLYLYLLQKREENELSQTFTAYNTRVLTPPTGSTSPIYPQGRRNLLMALVIGLLIPLVVVYIKEVSDSTVRGKKDLENLSLPFIGEIPQYTPRGVKRKFFRFFKTKKQKKVEKLGVKDTVVKEGKRDVINEAFRVLRTNLEFMTQDSKENVMILTSFNPGSGKTFLTVNIAITLAIKGKRVLIVDGDLRHGSLSAYVDRPKEGLSNYLAGQIDDINSVIVADEIRPSLHILPTGTIPPNPSELIGSERFENLIASMRSRYDYVIIDCPPVDIVADTQIIEKVTDRTIFVVRAGLLERSMLPELEKLYEEGKYKNMSLLLNGTLSEHNYGYRYGNRYGYKYGYKYGYYGYGGHKYYANDGE